jgi:hypothetical protein
MVELHARENNQESEDFLNENHERLSKQATYVLKLLKRGERLTVPKALGLGIMSLPRRIMDLKESGIEIKDTWLKDSNGKRIMKEWFIEIPKQPTKSELIANTIKISKSDLQDFWNDLQAGKHDTPIIDINRRNYVEQSLFPNYE